MTACRLLYPLPLPMVLGNWKMLSFSMTACRPLYPFLPPACGFGSKYICVSPWRSVDCCICSPCPSVVWAIGKYGVSTSPADCCIHSSLRQLKTCAFLHHLRRSWHSGANPTKPENDPDDEKNEDEAAISFRAITITRQIITVPEGRETHKFHPVYIERDLVGLSPCDSISSPHLFFPFLFLFGLSASSLGKTANGWMNSYGGTNDT